MVPLVRNAKLGGIDGVFLATASQLSGCEVTYENWACGVPREGTDSDCGQALLRNSSNLQLRAFVTESSALCEAQKLVISGSNEHTISTVLVDGKETTFTRINDTHSEVSLPPLNATSVLSTRLPGTFLDASPQGVDRAISVGITADDIEGQSDAWKNITFTHVISLVDLTCDLKARYTFSGSLEGVGPVAATGFTVQGALKPGSSQDWPFSFSNNSRARADNEGEDAFDLASNDTVSVWYAQGRTAMASTAVNASAASIVLPVVPAPEYTIAAWIQVPPSLEAPPAGWAAGVRANGTCGSGYPSYKLEISSCWKFVAMRKSASSALLTVGTEVISPEHRLAEQLQVRMAQSNYSYIGLSDLIVDDLWFWGRVIHDQELLELSQTESYAVQIGSGDSLSALEITLDDFIRTQIGLTPGFTLQRLPGGRKEFVSSEELIFQVDKTEATADNSLAEITCFVEVKTAGIYILRTLADDGIAITANNKTVSDLDRRSGEEQTPEPRDLEVFMEEPGFIAISLTHHNAENTAASLRLLIKQSTEDDSAFVPALMQAASGQWTVAMWMKPSDLSGSGAKVIMSADDWQIVAQGNAIQVILGWDQCESPLARDCSGVETFTFENVALVEDAWNHLVVSYSGSAVSVHVSGRYSSVATDPEHHSVGSTWLQNLVAGTLIASDDSTPALEYELYSLRLIARVISDDEVAAMHACSSAMINNTVIYHVFEEGFGSDTQHLMPTNSVVDEGIASFSMLHNALWVNTTCPSAQGLPGTPRLCGSPSLNDVAAGQLTTYSLEALDTCGSKQRAGGSCVTVRVYGGEKTWASSSCPGTSNVDSSSGMLQVIDRGDGSYDVNQRFTIAGQYNATIEFNSTARQHTINGTFTVHPGTASASLSSIEGVLTPGGLSPTVNAATGVPYKLRVNLLDDFGNVKDWGSLENDEFDVGVSFSPKQSAIYNISDNRDGTVDIHYLLHEPGMARFFVAILARVLAGFCETSYWDCHMAHL
jgi:hypothetical protein